MNGGEKDTKKKGKRDGTKLESIEKFLGMRKLEEGAIL